MACPRRACYIALHLAQTNPQHVLPPFSQHMLCYGAEHQQNTLAVLLSFFPVVCFSPCTKLEFPRRTSKTFVGNLLFLIKAKPQDISIQPAVSSLEDMRHNHVSRICCLNQEMSPATSATPASAWWCCCHEGRSETGACRGHRILLRKQQPSHSEGKVLHLGSFYLTFILPTVH